MAGAAVAVAAKYALDKASPLERKAAMAAVRHTVRNTFGDVIPESLHDKLMDSGFFDHEDEDFDGPQGETQDFFEEPEQEQSDDQDFFEEPDEEQSDDQDFFEEPDEEEESEDQDFFDEPEDDEPEDDEGDEPEDEPRATTRPSPRTTSTRTTSRATKTALSAPPTPPRPTVAPRRPMTWTCSADTPRRRRRTRRSSKVHPAE